MDCHVETGIPKKLEEMCRAITGEIFAKVKAGKEVSDEFMLQKGLRQQDAVAPLLFNVALEMATQNVCRDTTGNFFKSHQILASQEEGLKMCKRCLIPCRQHTNRTDHK
jgi:hypothetical protein